MSRTASLTTAFRNHIIDLPPGTETSTADHQAWVRENLPKLGTFLQTQHMADASCRCASQRPISAGWLTRVGARNVYRRTDKKAVRT
ncbi:hypothetical protein [Bradyrhizobium canariense]|uniref:Uncharacterized protein n=1 Tax=Bradyrhizobium canariense TaxID=255045 RepID=A0A1X3GVG6_9BRAD|nr:hypothetical protein [Bradyrhizobium canariense]OSI70856.1 hypothetical protein BSZ22_13135 [Bradyrhizobium canariense]OSI79697.1 hypothetical protein BSZ23_13655 [Bradyrhizobium canariense]OSI92314.1 hypothetical protein BSZ25_12640 [Bradyrhizobium canariense]OSI94036.1 hypothetical protein BSZ24_11395 [Bradyrhizobium canariense]OSJ01791.1 hypothetical protein BSZ18_38990 [Bradyrhizobium canariense]